jgi:hypothetical protein
MDIVDIRGSKIEPGDRVAYNLSGAVAVGEVLSVEDKGRTGYNNMYHKILIRIRFDKEWANLGSQKGYSTVSDVKFANNITGQFICYKVTVLS